VAVAHQGRCALPGGNNQRLVTSSPTIAGREAELPPLVKNFTNGLVVDGGGR
jgi:hypothetical protein